jgi:hypothetical protein
MLAGAVAPSSVSDGAPRTRFRRWASIGPTGATKSFTACKPFAASSVVLNIFVDDQVVDRGGASGLEGVEEAGHRLFISIGTRHVWPMTRSRVLRVTE